MSETHNGSVSEVSTHKHEDPSANTSTQVKKLGTVMNACHPSAGEVEAPWGPGSQSDSMRNAVSENMVDGF